MHERALQVLVALPGLPRTASPPKGKGKNRMSPFVSTRAPAVQTVPLPASLQHYPPTLLAVRGLEEECACEAWGGPAYMDWREMKAHPRTFT